MSGIEPNDPAEPVPELAGEESDAAPGRNLQRLLVAGGIALVVLLVVLGIVLWWPSPEADYDAEVEANFMAACTEDGGDAVAPVCECLYEGITEEIDFDRFTEVNDQLEARRAEEPGSPVVLPEDFDRIRARCVEQVGVEHPAPAEES